MLRQVRLLGDAKWPTTTPFEETLGAFTSCKPLNKLTFFRAAGWEDHSAQLADQQSRYNVRAFSSAVDQS